MVKNDVKHLVLLDKNGSFIGEINAFSYNAKRMGGAPNITATFYSFEQDKVDKDCYVVFNGEKYYTTKTPTSSKSNTDARYKYDLELRSERSALENIYFYDASYKNGDVVAQQTSFKFVGNVHSLAEKIQQSINFSYGYEYYKVIIDEGIDSDEKLIDFQDTNVIAAIQEFYNTFELPYYYVGVDGEGNSVREFHVGFESESVIDRDDALFEYGVDNPLIAITRSNANFKAINKITGIGSSDNLPPYYPNLSSTGEHTFSYDDRLGEVSINYDILNRYTNLRDGAKLTYNKKPEYEDSLLGVIYNTESGMLKSVSTSSFIDTMPFDSKQDEWTSSIYVRVHLIANMQYRFNVNFSAQTVGNATDDGIVEGDKCRIDFHDLRRDEDRFTSEECEYSLNGSLLTITAKKTSDFRIRLDLYATIKDKTSIRSYIGLNTSVTIEDVTFRYAEDFLTFDDSEKYVYISESGVSVENSIDGATITVSETLNWMQEQKVLMPSIYRATKARERFYLAKNSGHSVDGYSYNFGGNVFSNEYEVGRQVEHILKVEDLKPTIKGMTYDYNGTTYNIDQIADVAFDENDNNEIGENNEYKHPYFYVRLNPLGFNLFDHASAEGEMTVSMTSGDCNACQFTIGVVDGKNTVQINRDGSLLRDENGNVRSGRKGLTTETPQKEQNDTTNNSVWIALKKESNTFGTLLPIMNQQQPSIGDSFVFINIYLPNEYVFAAEKKLENEIKQYLIDNNDEKFTFSIKFSRVYLAENEAVRSALNENSRLTVSYFGKEVILYVSSFSYKITSGEILPEISVELSETLAINKGAMQNVINQVKADVMSSMANIDFVAQGARAFLRKDQNDQTVHKITVNEVKVIGDNSVGGNSEVRGNERVGGELSVDKKVTFHDSVTSDGDITIGEYTEILGEINGAKIDQEGRGVFKSVRANQLEIFTLIYNKIRATSAYTVFDDTATIKSIEVDDNGVYTLSFEGNDEYVQPFTEYDIIHGYVNSINNYGYSISGECWLNVIEVQPNDNNSQVKAVLFDDVDTPIGKNIPPTVNMVLAHKGNNAPKGLDDEKYDKRRNTFYISSSDGSIIQLLDVTSPKLLEVKDGYSNYGVVIGKLPDDLFAYVKSAYSFINQNHPYIYARGIVTQELLTLDYLGRPIKTERYRGEWNEKDATGNDPYRSFNATDVTYYDTVTFDGSKWQCFTDKTTEKPRINDASWTVVVSKGDGGYATSYWLYTDVPHVHINANGVPDATAINITVYKSSEDGIIALTTKEQIEAEGLEVQYSIDSTAPREDFELVDDGIIELEDGSGYIVGESDTQTTYLYTESDAIPFADVNKYIMFWLYDTNEDKDIDSLKVEISRDGVADTIDTIEYASSTSDSMDEVPTSWQSEKPQVIEGRYLWTKITYTPSGKVVYTTTYNGKDGASGKPIYISSTASTVIVNTGTVITSSGAEEVQVVQTVTKSIVLKCIYNNEEVSPSSYTVSEAESAFVTHVQYGSDVVVRVNIPAGTPVTQIPSSINVSMSVVDGDSTITANFDVVIMQSQRGLDGPQGEAGPLYVPFGTWSEADAKEEKYKVDPEQALPLVYYQRNKNERGAYYIHGGDNGKIKEGVAPNIDGSGWKWATSSPYVLAEMLMANFAKLGSEYGAVFYHKYLFSQYGIGRKEDGGYMDGSAQYSDFYESMFDHNNGDPTLNGGFIPSFFVDFLSGESKMNRLSLPFYDLPYGEEKVSYKIDLGVSHSVKADINKVVFLPNPTKIQNENVKTYEPDGVLCTIYAKPKPNYTELYKTPDARLQMKDTTKIPDIYTLDDSLTLVCADGRVSDYSSYYTEDIDVGGNKNKVVYNPLKSNFNSFGQYDGMGYFLIEGVPVKFIVLEPGAILKLRSCYTTAGRGDYETTGLFWVVENASDFAQINFTAETYLDEGLNQTAYVWSCPSHMNVYSPQIEIAYGSSFIRYVQSKGTDSLQSSDMLKARIYVTADGINIDDSLFVNQ